MYVKYFTIKLGEGACGEIVLDTSVSLKIYVVLPDLTTF